MADSIQSDDYSMQLAPFAPETVDKIAAVLQRILEHMDVQVLEGSGCSPKVLGEAGITKADMLLAVTDSDEINLMACTFANMLAPGARSICSMVRTTSTSGLMIIPMPMPLASC